MSSTIYIYIYNDRLSVLCGAEYEIEESCFGGIAAAGGREAV